MKGEWIPATQPPADGKTVLIYWAGRSMCRDSEKIYLGEFNTTLGYWRPMGSNGNYSDQITHWMPLPEPPKC